jgi:hypothetical protein
MVIFTYNLKTKRMKSTKEKLEEVFGVRLSVTLDTRDEVGCEDEEFGHFIQCVPELSDWNEELELPTIVIYEDDLVQFFHDSTPYPVAANAQYAREMSMFLEPFPVKVDLITKKDFDDFINAIDE